MYQVACFVLNLFNFWFSCSHWVIFCYIQWTVVGSVDVNIGANPSAEGDGEDEGVDDQAAKVVDIVDTFRLQVGFCLWLYTRISNCLC